MVARSRISTRVEVGPALPARTGPLQAAQELRFHSDSKSLSSFLTAYISRQFPLMPLPSEIGQERAFTEAPVTFKALQPKVARRNS